MVRSMAALVFLAACGSGVCAGCSDDGGDPELPDAFMLGFELVQPGCSAGSVQQLIEGARGPTPGSGESTICDPVVDDGDAWRFDCQFTAGPTSGTMAIHLAKSLDGGSIDFTWTGVGGACDGTYPIASVEIVTP